MESIEQFLDQDIPLFLDGFANEKKVSAAEADEISSLLKSPSSKDMSLSSSKNTSIEKTTNLMSSPEIKANTINISVNKLETNTTTDSVDNKSSSSAADDLFDVPIPKHPISKAPIKNPSSVLVPKSLPDKIKISKPVKHLSEEDIKRIRSERPEQIGINKNLDDYVTALIALEKKDKPLAVSSFYLLAKKFPNNIAILTRLHDALHLKGEEIIIPPIPKLTKSKKQSLSLENSSKETKQSKEKVLEKISSNKSPNQIKIAKEIKSGVVVNNISNKSTNVVIPKDPLEKYVSGIKAIKKHNKDLAVKIFTDLVRQYPKNISFKLRLQKALKM